MENIEKIDKKIKKMESTNYCSFKIRTFGNLLSNLRKSLDLTQEDFGKLILISRVTAVKIERFEDVNELSDHLLFRLNHLSFRLMSNENFDDFVMLCAEKVYNITYDELSKRMIDNTDNMILNLIIKN